jgi:hypothetical protein
MSTLSVTDDVITSNTKDSFDWEGRLDEMLANDRSSFLMAHSIARRLHPQVAAKIDRHPTELIGWARVGMMKARQEFKASSIPGSIDDPDNYLAKYILVKGYYRALDDMRKAGVTMRSRGAKGKPSGAAIFPHSFTDVLVKSNAPHKNNALNVADHRNPEPSVQAEQGDLYDCLVGKLEGDERVICELRLKSDMSLVDIATHLGQKPKHVRYVYQTVIQRFRESLGMPKVLSRE